MGRGPCTGRSASRLPGPAPGCSRREGFPFSAPGHRHGVQALCPGFENTPILSVTRKNTEKSEIFTFCGRFLPGFGLCRPFFPPETAHSAAKSPLICICLCCFVLFRRNSPVPPQIPPEISEKSDFPLPECPKTQTLQENPRGTAQAPGRGSGRRAAPPAPHV